MKKITCDIVEDLLPLYIDGSCSDDSREAVEEHLRMCEKCRLIYERMLKNEPVGSSGSDDEITQRSILAFSKKVKRKKDRIFIFGTAFIIVCLIIIFSLPVFLMSNSPKINDVLESWMDDNIRDSRDSIKYYLTFSMSENYERPDPKAEGMDFTDEITALNNTYVVNFDRRNGLMSIKEYAKGYTLNGVYTEEDRPLTDPQEWIVDLTGNGVRVFSITDEGITDTVIGDRAFAESISNALMPDDVSVFTDLQNRIGEASFTGKGMFFSKGELDYSNYIMIDPKIFTEPFGMLTDDEYMLNGTIWVHYNTESPDREEAPYYSIYLSSNDLPDLTAEAFEYIYKAVMGEDYENVYTQRGLRYNIEFRLEFPEDMYDADPIEVPGSDL